MTSTTARSRAITFKDMLDVLFRREFYIDMAVFFGICVTGVVAVLFGMTRIDRYFGLKPFVGFPYNIVLFAVLSATGFAIVWRAYTYLVIVGRGSPCPQIGGTRELVDTGPYAVVRHPSVLGKLSGIVGLGCLSGSVTFTFILIPLLMAWSAYYNRFIQEKVCEERFGEAYRAYRRQVPMFVPHIRIPFRAGKAEGNAD